MVPRMLVPLGKTWFGREGVLDRVCVEDHIRHIGLKGGLATEVETLPESG